MAKKFGSCDGLPAFRSAPQLLDCLLKGSVRRAKEPQYETDETHHGVQLPIVSILATLILCAESDEIAKSLSLTSP